MVFDWPFKRQSNQIAKHTQTIRRQFDYFVELALKGLKLFQMKTWRIWISSVNNKHLIKITLSIPHQTMIETKRWQHKKISSTAQYETLVSRDSKNSVSLNQSALLLHHVVLITLSFWDRAELQIRKDPYNFFKN